MWPRRNVIRASPTGTLALVRSAGLCAYGAIGRGKPAPQKMSGQGRYRPPWVCRSLAARRAGQLRQSWSPHSRRGTCRPPHPPSLRSVADSPPLWGLRPPRPSGAAPLLRSAGKRGRAVGFYAPHVVSFYKSLICNQFSCKSALVRFHRKTTSACTLFWGFGATCIRRIGGNADTPYTGSHQRAQRGGSAPQGSGFAQQSVRRTLCYKSGPVLRCLRQLRTPHSHAQVHPRHPQDESR